MREDGFVPWDADFDLMIFDNQYEEAIRILKEKLPNDMFVEDETVEKKYFHGWAHVKDRNSIVYHNNVNQDCVYENKGITLDLYRGYFVKRKDLVAFQYEQNELYLERRKKSGTITDDEIESKRKKKEEENKYLQNEISVG